MKSLFQRCLSWLFEKPPRVVRDTGATPAPPPNRRAPAPPGEADTTAARELAAICARRPLIAADGAVAGFEFRIGEDISRRLKRQSDSHAQAARVLALLTSAQQVGQAGHIGFARLPAPWLMHAAEADIGSGVCIGLESIPTLVPAQQSSIAIETAVLALRAKGVRVGWAPGFDAPILPDFVLLLQGAHAMSTVLESMAAWPTAWHSLPVFVSDIGAVEDLEMALYNGATYACGKLDSEATTATATAASGQSPLLPKVQRVGLLLSQLTAGADTAVIVDEIKGDIGLSYRLLRLMNNASYAQLGSNASVEQAVLVLGRYELHRWLSVLLMEFAGSRKAASALQEVTLWRSRLLELMAIEQQERAPEQFFTLGLASMLGQLLKITEPEVVSALNLPAFARQALLEHAGPYYPYLALVKRLEVRPLNLSDDIAAKFRDTARLLKLSDQAWQWAAKQRVGA